MTDFFNQMNNDQKSNAPKTSKKGFGSDDMVDQDCEEDGDFDLQKYNKLGLKLKFAKPKSYKKVAEKNINDD